MARVEQKYLVDRETVEHLIEMLRDGVERGGRQRQGDAGAGLGDTLDSQYRAKTDQAFKEMNEGRVRRFKNANQMIHDLESH